VRCQEGGRKAAFLFVHNKQVRTSGFSLIELIVVMVVMAILIGIAAPRFFGQGEFEGPAFAQELASAARYAQKVAVVSGCRVDLVVSATGYGLFKPQDTTPKCGSTPTMTLPVKHPATGEPFAATTPAGVAIGGTLGTVQFAASGVPNVAASFTVGTQSVTIAANSGYVSVQ
jgi:MSHA pilin protein MshC